MNLPKRNFSQIPSQAILIFTWTLMLAILMQAQNTWRFTTEPNADLLYKFLMLSALLLAQGQNILVAVLLGLLTYFSGRRLILQLGSLTVAILVNLIIVLDTVAYRLYFQHFQIEMGDGGIPPFQ